MQRNPQRPDPENAIRAGLTMADYEELKLSVTLVDIILTADVPPTPLRREFLRYGRSL
jgi:hypothetical protein